jgi:hypothetical protein
MSDGWVRVFGAETPFDQLPAIVERFARHALEDLQVQLAADATLTDAQRTAMLSRAAPLIHQRTRETFERAWQRLQSVH